MSVLNQKFNTLLHRHPWALQVSLASLLGLLAIANIVGTTLAARSDWPWPYNPFNPTNDLTELQIGYPDEFFPNGGSSLSRTFLSGDTTRIAWQLSQPASHYADWKIDLYVLKAESNSNQTNPKLYPIATDLPATGQGSDSAGRYLYTWNTPMEYASYQDVPNPYDRHIYAVLRGPDTEGNLVDTSWNVTRSFSLMLWKITNPRGGNLTVGDMVNVTWSTNLSGRARLYLETKKDNNVIVHLPVVGEFPKIQNEVVAWKVGYTQSAPGGAWFKLDPEVFDLDSHLYLVPLEYDKPLGYYFGYDYDDSTTDQQPAFVMTEAEIVSPTLSSLSPITGPTAGGTIVYLTGQNLHLVDRVTFGGTNATNVVPSADGKTVVATTPAHLAGRVDVSVFTSDSQQATLDQAFTYSQPPTKADLTFDTTRGNQGFVLTPLIFQSTEKVAAAVWVKNAGIEASPASAVSFSIGLDHYEFDQLAAPVPPLPAGESTLVYLVPTDEKDNPAAGLTASGDKLYFKLTVDPSNLIIEDNELNNDYGGEGATAIDFSQVGAVMHVSGPTANPQYNPDQSQIDINVGDTTSSVIWLNEANLPADYLADTGMVTLLYDPTVVTPDINSIQGGGHRGGVTATYLAEKSDPGHLAIQFDIADLTTQTPPGGFFGLITTEWEAIGMGTTEIALQWTAAGIEDDGTDVFDTDTSTSTIDLLRRVEPDGFDITVGQAPLAISATYYSAPIDLTAGGVFRPSLLNQLVANYSEGEGLVKFSIGFFHKNTDGTYTQKGVGFISPDGYYLVDMAAPNNGALPDFGSQYSWFPELTDIKFKIEMSTPNVIGSDVAQQPWVENLSLEYDVQDVASEIGYIKFQNEDTDPDANRFLLDPNTDVEVVFTVHPMNQYVNGTIQLTLGDIRNKATNEIETTISGNFISHPNGRINIVDAAPVTVTARFTAAATTPNGLYSFLITGVDLVNAEWMLVPKTNGELLVGGTLPTAQFVVEVGDGTNPAIQTVARGQQVTYNISVTRISTYTGTIALTTDIQSPSIFGASIQSAVLNPSSITFSSSDVVVPGGPVLTKTATLTVTASANATILDQQKTFSVTGTDTASDVAVADPAPKLTIASSIMTLNLTIPLEAGTYPSDPTKYYNVVGQHPLFSVRVYRGATMAAQATDFHTNTANQASVTIATLDPGAYTVYARTSRHLWKKSTADLTVVDGTTTYNLTWAAIGLPAGNFDDNNTINVQDYSYIANGILQGSGDNIHGDVNNDGGVSSVDYSFLVNLFNNVAKYLMSGDPLPDGSI